MKIIPAIDIINGRCVRLTEGDYSTEKVYSESPLEVAKNFEKAGLSNLHLVDLDGAKSGSIVNSDVLKSISTETNLTVDFGGGVKTEADVELAFSCGASQVTVGSLAVKDQKKTSEWFERFGGEKIILGADVKDGKIAISGWKEVTDITITELIKIYIPFGLKYCICTDVSKDGKLEGVSREFYADLQEQFPEVNFVASGGVTSIEDVKMLKGMNMYGAIIGKAIYEGLLPLEELAKLC